MAQWYSWYSDLLLKPHSKTASWKISGDFWEISLTKPTEIRSFLGDFTPLIEASFPWISSALADATDVASSRGLKPGPVSWCGCAALLGALEAACGWQSEACHPKIYQDIKDGAILYHLMDYHWSMPRILLMIHCKVEVVRRISWHVDRATKYKMMELR